MTITDPVHRFKIDQVVPLPMEHLGSDSEVWGKRLYFEKGISYTLLAASGRGKSTLAHFLLGLRSDYHGEIQYGGKKLPVNQEQILQFRKENCAVVFQDLRLFEELTAMENIRLHQSDTATGLDEGVLIEYAEQMGVKAFLDKPIALLSYGQQQRMSILRAVSRPFDWIILDEPFSHLDEANQAIAASIIEQERQRNGAGMLLFGLDGIPQVFGNQLELRL